MTEGSTSQHGEDLLVAAHFAHKRDGYFVEVGALDGVTYSNTHFLEQQLGWRGVLVEADPLQAEKCAQARPRSTTVAKAATSPDRSGSTMELTVVSGDEALSTFDLTDRTARLIEADRHAGRDIRTETRVVVSSTLDEMLRGAGAPTQMDFLSLDIEGHEAEALRGLSLGTEWEFSVLLVENNRPLPDYEVSRHLARAGYRYVRTVAHINDWYEPSGRGGIAAGFVLQHVSALRSIVRRVLLTTVRRLGVHDQARAVKHRVRRLARRPR